ncbi:hypothetical protein JTE90_006129 [Oedothorax gibbosus]|uniref:Secreted protein n=1 Tax=Oedothorax gibbosus TaxID=931172 RepID=A0AAV6V5K1_9ARAC|nr:hypothetical protein JTE90_006129 [Oedothorax gibbosus]
MLSLSLLLIAALSTHCAGVPTVYDVLQLVYQLCSTAEAVREERLDCVGEHLGREVSPAVSRCLPPVLCARTLEWAAKHPDTPPHRITRVLGLGALGRMGCVLGEVPRPLPVWKAAFAKCFPDFQSVDSLNKDGSTGRSGNSLADR